MKYTINLKNIPEESILEVTENKQIIKQYKIKTHNQKITDKIKTNGNLLFSLYSPNKKLLVAEMIKRGDFKK